MKKSHLYVVAFAIFSLGFAAFANEKGKPGSDMPTAAASAVTWAQFQAYCHSPKTGPVQATPENIRLRCTDYHREYINAAPAEFPLEETRRVQAHLISDKYFVHYEPTSVPTTGKAGTCARFKEVEKSFSIERVLTCNDILGMKSTPEEICLSALDRAKGGNPKLIQVQDTGRVIDTCGSLTTATPAKGSS